MSKLVPRYTRHELATLVTCIYPEERRSLYTDKEWKLEGGFRHYLDPKIVCIEHFKPKPLPPGHWLSRKPAA